MYIFLSLPSAIIRDNLIHRAERGPHGREHSSLPALATNLPLADLLNASRPEGEGFKMSPPKADNNSEGFPSGEAVSGAD